MNIQQIPQEWIDNFNDLSNRGLLKPSVIYDVFLSLPTLYGKPMHTLKKVAEFDTDYYRYVAAHIVFKDTKPVHYELALKGNEDLSILDDESYIGFTVDAGLATIVEEAIIQRYQEFIAQWYLEHIDGNIYDDYLNHLFRFNAIANPQY